MKNQSKDQPIVYHKDHIPASVKDQEHTYTENWNIVTDPKALAVRRRELAGTNVAEPEAHGQPE